ncbi:MAG: excinuclease ABC subunit C [Ignavibacteria bacterium GWC2_56_12]|nr:MAG: excinuclease ABC subunit C [Ignavibacteria bacterium GWC2_56_12]
MENDGPSTILIGSNDLSLAEKLDSLPAQPGVYQFKNNEGKVLYVGKASNLRSRVRQYFQRSRSVEPRIDAMVRKIHDVELTVTSSEVEALILEANLIKQFKPRYNVVLKDDKSYPYIVITKELYPRVFVTRRKVSGARYFGPYTDVKTMRFALKTVRDIFMIRSCNYDLTDETITAGKYKVCLDYHIKKCEGPCEGLVSHEHYNRMIDQVAQVLRGRTHPVVDAIETEMQRLADDLRFEEAARLRDRMQALRVYTEKQRMVESKEAERDVFAVAARGDDACGVVFKVREGKVVGSLHMYMSHAEGRSESDLVEQFVERYYLDEEDIPGEIMLSSPIETVKVFSAWLKAKAGRDVAFEVPQTGERAKLIAMVRSNAQFWLDELEVQRLKRGETVPHAVKMLQTDLRLSSLPRRIECFDNSNIQGSDPVSSMVVFVDGKPKKSEYRKFRVRTVTGSDDFETMREIIQRRYRRVVAGEIPPPDLIVVDGGKGQLSSAVSVLRELGLEHLPIIGLAKRLEEVFVPEVQDSVQLPRTSASLRLLQHLRDEAHRFAITFHRRVRSKRILSTELDLIEGIGKKRAAELLEAFGSVQGVKFATQEQLEEVVGEKVAEKIKSYFASEENEESRE